jgi:rubrerythrin
MGDDKTTEILKSAILMEKRGQAFYEKVAQQTSSYPNPFRTV